MINHIWATSSKKRQEFDDQFAELVNDYVETYKGGQPIISWFSDSVEPKIHKNFFDHLPSHIQSRIKKLIQKLYN
jgi:hypothetical protein